MGRKALPIEPYIGKLEKALAVGATYELAAMFAGISVSTFERWRHQAAEAAPHTTLGRLRDRLKQAEGRAAIGWLDKIEKAAKEGDWHAAAWKMERRYPEQYGRRERIDVRLNIQAMAARVAAEHGLTPEDVLAEAQAMLAEVDRGTALLGPPTR